MKKVSKAKKARYLQMDKWKNDSNGSFPRHSPRNERVSHIFTLQKEEKNMLLVYNFLPGEHAFQNNGIIKTIVRYTEAEKNWEESVSILDVLKEIM